MLGGFLIGLVCLEVSQHFFFFVYYWVSAGLPADLSEARVEVGRS